MAESVFVNKIGVAATAEAMPCRATRRDTFVDRVFRFSDMPSVSHWKEIPEKLSRVGNFTAKSVLRRYDT